MGGEVKRSSVVPAVLGQYQDTILVIELAEIHAVLVIVDTQHILIEPYFASAEGRVPLLLEGNRLYLEFREHVSSRRTGFDSQFGQVLADLQFLEVQLRFERHADDLRLAVRVGGKIDDLRSRLTLRQVVFLVPRHARDIEPFHEIRTLLAVAIDYVIDRPLIAALENRNMQYIGADE